MIQLSNLTLLRGSRCLLDQANLTLFGGWKVGLIGSNGAGKSSFFKLLLGELHPDGGEISCAGSPRIAHMAQEVVHSERTALEYVMDGDQQLRTLQRRLSQAEVDGAHDQLGELHAELEACGGYSAEARAATLLDGLGFQTGDLQRSVSDFSGGWQIRLNLAQALMCPSDLLLLDEPTNHLDLDATLWLEQFLKNYPGTLLLISHDREFLDAVVGHVVHLHAQKTDLYKGNYSRFERARAERFAQQQASYEKQQVRIQEIENFVRRFRAKATKARQAQSRLKELERMEEIAPAHIDSPFSFTFTSSDKLSSPLLQLEFADCGYNLAAPILSKLNLTITAGDRIGLLGPNGAGKSTLIKTLTGELATLSGHRFGGENLRVGYFAQHQLEALDLEASPVQHLKRLSPEVDEIKLRSFIGSFGFHGDDALDPVKRFSGGEKARLALALIAWQRPNLLLMDEPTNHLDLEVRHALTVALQSFEGALILVSHDRHLLKNTVDSFLLVADHNAVPFDGDLGDYQTWLNQKKRDSAGEIKPAQESKASAGNSAADRKEQKRLEAEKRNKLRPLKQTVEKLEKQIEKIEQGLSKIEVQLADPSLYEESQKAKLKQLLSEQGELKSSAEDLETEWMEAQEALEALEASL